MFLVERLAESASTRDITWQGDTLPAPAVVEGHDSIRLVVAVGPLTSRQSERANSLGAAYLVDPEGGWFTPLAPGAVPGALRAPLPPSDGLVEGLDLELAWEAYEPPQAARDPFCNIHTHTDASSLDGLTTVAELIEVERSLGHDTVCVTDHGHCSNHIDLLRQATAADMRALLGLETYWVPDRRARGKDSPPYNHLILWALTQEGLTNLWALSSEAHRTGFYQKPRADWDLLERYGAGLGVSTACLRGPVNAEPEVARDWLARAASIFPDRLWVEIHTNQLPEQIDLNRRLVDLAKEAGLPLIAATDSHYPRPGDKDTHRLWLTAQTHGGTKKADEGADDSGLFHGDQDYHLAGSAEVRSKLSYLPSAAVDEAVAQTMVVADLVQVETPAKAVAPMYDPARGRQYAVERIRAICEANWDRRVRGKPEPKGESYRERFEREMAVLTERDFIDYFMVTADYVRHAKANGVLCGCGRGSGAGSLVAYLCDITEVDPVYYDLIFERFMTRGRVDPPDFDVDFPTSKASLMQDYITNRWGADNVVRVGSVLRMRNRKAIKAARQMLVDSGADISFMDIEEVCKIIEEEESDSAGLGKPFAEVMSNAEEALAPYRNRYPQVFALAGKIVGRISAYGKHASGMVISTSSEGSSLIQRLPLRRGSDVGDEGVSTAETMVTEFDFRVLESLGFLKADFLFLRTLDTLQMCADLIRQRRGLEIIPYDWTAELEDPQVWDAMCDGQTLGCFQIETPSLTRLVKRHQPRSILDLADVITLVRPGPMRSGITETYLRRRFGEEEVSYLDSRLEAVLAPSHGVMIYQEQIMQVTRVLAGYDDVQADAIRKLLGKKQKDKVEAAGREFVEAAVARGTARDVAAILWSQMALSALYVFNKAHAVSYALLAYWTQYYRVHFPEEFFTAVLSTLSSASAKQRVPDFVSEVRRVGMSVQPPDINLSKEGFTAGPLTVRYGLGQIKGIGEKVVPHLIANQPYASFEDFRQKVKTTPVNIGHIKTLAAVGAFDSLEPNRRALERMLEADASGESTVCIHHSPHINAHSLPCAYDWDNEPVELTAKGKPKVRKVPARCTKACRHYAPGGFSMEGIEPYTPAQIRDREMETLGVWLSSTPFDRIPDEMWAELVEPSQFDSLVPGVYVMPGVVKRIKEIKDAAGRHMAFLTVAVKEEEVEMVAFSDAWKKCKPLLKATVLGLYEVAIGGRGIQLRGFSPVPD